MRLTAGKVLLAQSMLASESGFPWKLPFIELRPQTHFLSLKRWLRIKNPHSLAMRRIDEGTF
jgi:hypothetical protein